MHIAVTGATGFIGRYIVEHLVEHGHTCRCWYRTDSSRKALSEFGDAVQWMPGELDGGAEPEFVAGCDAVVHAALHHPGGGFRGGEGDIVQFVERNVVGTIRLIEAAVAAAVGRFVFISTCAVHEKILDDRPLDEAHPLWPSSHYGAHKAALEKFVHSYGFGAGLPICALRPTGVYGVHQRVEQSKWFDLVEDVAAGRPVMCRRGGKEVHASDVGRAVGVLLAANAAAITGQAFNCYDRYVSELEVASLAQEASGVRGLIEGEPMAPKHQIETSKLKALGMEFGGRRLLKSTVEQLVEFIRTRG